MSLGCHPVFDKVGSGGELCGECDFYEHLYHALLPPCVGKWFGPLGACRARGDVPRSVESRDTRVGLRCGNSYSILVSDSIYLNLFVKCYEEH